MAKEFIMTLDEGTTSARTLITNQKGEVVAVSQQEFTQHFPKSGWVEHDAIEIWNTQMLTMINAKRKAGIKSTDIAAIGITNQRETIVVWDKETHLPIHNALVWQDQRTAEACEKMIQSKKDLPFKKKTGLLINPYFSGTKLKWLLDNVPGARKKAEEGRLLAGTIDSWLIWKLTSGKVHATDVSNASRTLLFNIHTQKWDAELCELLDIPMNILPEVKASSEVYGYIDPKHFSVKSEGIVPIAGVAGDQQSALFGQLATNIGDVKNTYGTGCFTLINIGTEPIASKNQLLTTIAWKIGKEQTVYAIEGSVFMGGASLQWLRDGLKVLYNANQADSYANLIKDDDQRVYVVPAFTGLGAPYWDSTARGAIFGLERGTKREHIIKATLESIAYQSNDLIKAMSKDIDKPIKTLKVDGGACQSDYLMQFQSSISNVEVMRPKNIETTAMGAAYLAGLAVGFWKSIDELKKIVEIDKKYQPKMKDIHVQKLISGWEQAVKRTFNWTKDIS